jgi:hypothetical protein
MCFASWCAAAAPILPGEFIERLVQPWPPAGWSIRLELPRAVPYQSEPRVSEGYFGQSLYRHISGTSEYWTANVLIQDRGSDSAAWRAVSAVRCASRNHLGHRARECTRRTGGALIRTLHYEVGRFYVTIQVSGPGEVDYPLFELQGAGPPLSPRSPLRRGTPRSAR